MSTILEQISNFFTPLKFGINADFSIQEKADSMPNEHMDWAIRHGNFDKTGFTGKGERVGILDSGIDPNHADLRGQVDAHCFIDGCQDSPSYLDHIGHGTFCAGEIVAKQDGIGIVGVAPEASAFCGKVLYGNHMDGYVSNFERILANAINAAANDGCGVISMSLGMNKKSSIVEQAVNNAVEKGILIFAAAGNEGMQGSPYKSYPASFTNVISVAAANSKDLPHWFTTYGQGENRYEQPEVAIASLEYYWGCLPQNKYGKMIGTSMACPMMAGVALLWRQAMRSKGILPTGKDVLGSFRKWIERTAKDTNKNGWDAALGFGVILLQGGINVG